MLRMFINSVRFSEKIAVKKELNSWLLSLDSVDKHDLKSSLLGIHHSFHQVKIPWDLLKATATF